MVAAGTVPSSNRMSGAVLAVSVPDCATRPKAPPASAHKATNPKMRAPTRRLLTGTTAENRGGRGLCRKAGGEEMLGKHLKQSVSKLGLKTGRACPAPGFAVG